jgi:hypothetical protein
VPVEVEEGKGATGWSGTCTFSRPGTYAFYCSIHGPSMHGTIVVSAGGSTVSVQPPSSGGPLVGAASPNETQAPGSAGSSGSPPAGTVAAVKLAGSQRGRSVHGSLSVSDAGAGGQLEVVLFASAASPPKPGHSRRVRVGRLLRSSVRAGRVTFAVALSAEANGALRSRRRLSLTVEIRLTPAHGASVTITRIVVLRA